MEQRKSGWSLAWSTTGIVTTLIQLAIGSYVTAVAGVALGVLAGVLVCIFGFWLRVTRIEWCLLLLAMAGVWTAEGFNTSIELLADVVSPEYHPGIRKVKDAAAGAVLLMSIGAAIMGFLVLGPPLLRKLGL